MSMWDLKNHIFAVAEDSGADVTNLQLHKVMFLSFCWILQHEGPNSEIVEVTYDVPFQKWMYGPVIESIYHEYSMFGRTPIQTDEGERIEEFDNIPGLNSFIENLLNEDPFRLVDITHKMNSWANFEQDILERNYVAPYTIEEINNDLVQQ